MKGWRDLVAPQVHASKPLLEFTQVARQIVDADKADRAGFFLGYSGREAPSMQKTEFIL